MADRVQPTLDVGAPSVSLADQIACVEREIRLRERAYPRWVMNGRMKPATADREIALMQAVLATLHGMRP